MQTFTNCLKICSCCLHENLISGSIQKACDADSTTSSATVTRTISPGRSFEHHVTSQAQVSVGNVPLSPSRVPPSTSTAATTSSNEVPFSLTYPPLYVTAPAAMHTHQGYLNNQHPGSQHQSHSGHQQLNQVQAEQHSTSTEASNSFSSNQELWQTQVNGQIFELRDQIRELKAQVEMLKTTNANIRMDMSRGQKALTDRIQILMAELDETKKQRAGDSIELQRLRTLLLQLDAKSLNLPIWGKGSSSVCSAGPISGPLAPNDTEATSNPSTPTPFASAHGPHPSGLSSRVLHTPTTSSAGGVGNGYMSAGHLIARPSRGAPLGSPIATKRKMRPRQPPKNESFCESSLETEGDEGGINKVEETSRDRSWDRDREHDLEQVGRVSVDLNTSNVVRPRSTAASALAYSRR